MNLLQDEKCQSMLKKFQVRLRIEKWLMICIAILLSLILIFMFSEISIYNQDFSFHYSLGLGWVGFILSYVLVFIVWVVYSVSKTILQFIESQKLYTYMVNECDPLCTIYILDKLVQKKLFKEVNVLRAMIDTLKMLNHKERIIYLLKKYPNAEKNSNIRMNDEYFVLSNEDRELQYFDYYEKMRAFFLYQKINIKKKEQLINIEKAELSYDIEYYFYKKEYQKSIDVIEELGEWSPLFNVSSHLMMAKCYLGLENNEKAKECLDYVFKHGNTTYYVQKAKEMMEQLS